ncbi:MAG: hypothetical protein ACO32I_05525, partial [Candidatus Limnocylindrus sp.]
MSRKTHYQNQRDINQLAHALSGGTHAREYESYSAHEGKQAFDEFVMSSASPLEKRAYAGLVGAAVGGAAGALAGGPDNRVGGAIMGAGLGLGAGMGAKALFSRAGGAAQGGSHYVTPTFENGMFTAKNLELPGVSGPVTPEAFRNYAGHDIAGATKVRAGGPLVTEAEFKAQQRFIGGQHTPERLQSYLQAEISAGRMTPDVAQNLHNTSYASYSPQGGGPLFKSASLRLARTLEKRASLGVAALGAGVGGVGGALINKNDRKTG